MNGTAPGAPSAAGVPSPAEAVPGGVAPGPAAAPEAPLQVTRALLRTLPVLSLLTEEQLAQVVASARVSRFPKRATVVLKGREVDSLGFLLAGKLQVVDYLPDGREFGLNIIHAGQFFGELSVIDGLPRSASLIALGPSTVLQVPGELARRLLYRYPPVAEAMMRHLSQAVRRMSDMRALQAMPNAFQRVYALLARMTEAGPSGLHAIDEMPTHQEIAIMVNTSRETVTRALARLRELGVVQKDRRRMLVRSPEALRQLVEDPDAPLPAAPRG